MLCEPIGRNTAPCIAYAAYTLQKINPHARMIVTPSDHLILNEVDFHAIIRECLEFAQAESALMTVGIKPSRPDTGYGYIQISNNNIISKVKCFTEKPNLELAQTFVECGAPEEILYLNKPHIGTDVLRNVVKELRNRILAYLFGQWRVSLKHFRAIFPNTMHYSLA